ncbi:hypothetical protein [Thalassotalea aquiviva]|uniref:hypothetical protein n=1 Tax=Thalassotalea aquiviva TaxID=3242415 RepID=UPI00352A87A9
MYKSLMMLLLTVYVGGVEAQSDPTRPLNKSLATEQTQGLSISLTSIIGSAPKRTAIINEKMLKQGDKLGRFTVQSISRNKVVLADGQKTVELSLFSTKVIN